MPLPTGDVSNLNPPTMPGASPDLPPPPPGAAPTRAQPQVDPPAGAAVDTAPIPETPATQTQQAPAQATAGPPSAPFTAEPTQDRPSTQPAAETSQEVATTTEHSRAMTASGGAGHAIMQEAADLGFEGVDVTKFGVFPIISLQRGFFKTTEGANLGPSFRGYPQWSRKKWIYKNNLADSDPRSAFFYTYDGETTIKGQEISEVLAQWNEQGWRHIINPYVELCVHVYGGEHDGEAMALSIPKTGISRFSNFYLRLRQLGIERMKSTLCEFGQGPEVTGPNIKNPWIPITFKILK